MTWKVLYGGRLRKWLAQLLPNGSSHLERMIDINLFRNLPLRGGFTIVGVELRAEPLVDAIGREALAKTSILGQRFDILIRAPLSDKELSITLYHEILEAMTVASTHPPASVAPFNEGDFEAAARQAHERLGPASPENLDRMLQSYGFSEQ